MPKPGLIPLQKKIMLQDRRRRIAEIYAKYPKIKQREVADMLGVDRAQVSRDLKIITQEWQEERITAFEIHLARQLEELEEIKDDCKQRLGRIKNAHQGSRWTEMQIKCLDRQAKLLGLYAPEKHMIAAEVQSKEDRDAVVRAAIMVVQGNPGLPTQTAIEPAMDADVTEVIDVAPANPQDSHGPTTD